MAPDIVIVRDSDGYRLLHGYLRLANLLNASNEAMVEIKGEGMVRITRTRHGYIVGKDEQRMPLH
jgi:hypothetical protein